VKVASIHLSELAINDILEQANWYESRSDEKLAKRWERAVTSTLSRIDRTPNSGSPCRFRAAELLATRRVPVSGFSKHLVFYKVERREVFVLRVIHGALDLESLFAG